MPPSPRQRSAPAYHHLSASDANDINPWPSDPLVINMLPNFTGHSLAHALRRCHPTIRTVHLGGGGGGEGGEGGSWKPSAATSALTQPAALLAACYVRAP